MELWKAIEPSLKAASEEKTTAPPGGKVSGFDTTARVQNPQNDAAPPRPGGSGVQVRAAGAAIAMPAVARDPNPVPVMMRPTPMPPAPDRVSEAQAASPAAWSWSVLTTAARPAVAARRGVPTHGRCRGRHLLDRPHALGARRVDARLASRSRPAVRGAGRALAARRQRAALR